MPKRFDFNINDGTLLEMYRTLDPVLMVFSATNFALDFMRSDNFESVRLSLCGHLLTLRKERTRPIVVVMVY